MPRATGVKSPQRTPVPHSPKEIAASMRGGTVDGRNPATQLRLVVYPSICKVLYIPGGAGFQPSTECACYIQNFPEMKSFGTKGFLEFNF